MTAIAVESNSKVDEVEAYLFEKRRAAAQKKKITKFVEALWRFSFYTAFTVIGGITLFTPSPVPWVMDSNQYWIGWPFQQLYEPIKFYYFVELGAYIHQIMWTEVHRSDALEMLVHHFATIGLIVLSYLANLTRVGAVILFLHDISDVFLEAAKCFNYAAKTGKRALCGTISEVIFAAFAIVFFITRLVIYPSNVIYGAMFTAPAILSHLDKQYVGYYVLLALLIILQALHIFWFYLIAKMVFQLVTGTMQKDIRSDDEGEADEVPEGTTKNASSKKKAT